MRRRVQLVPALVVAGAGVVAAGVETTEAGLGLVAQLGHDVAISVEGEHLLVDHGALAELKAGFGAHGHFADRLLDSATDSNLDGVEIVRRGAEVGFGPDLSERIAVEVHALGDLWAEPCVHTGEEVVTGKERSEAVWTALRDLRGKEIHPRTLLADGDVTASAVECATGLVPADVADDEVVSVDHFETADVEPVCGSRDAQFGFVKVE